MNATHPSQPGRHAPPRTSAYPQHTATALRRKASAPWLARVLGLAMALALTGSFSAGAASSTTNSEAASPTTGAEAASQTTNAEAASPTVGGEVASLPMSSTGAASPTTGPGLDSPAIGMEAVSPAAGIAPTRHALGDIEYLEVRRGERPLRLLLFVHGTPGSARAFASYLNDPLLQRHFHMIAVTRPGWVRRGDRKVTQLDTHSAALEPLLRKNESRQGAILMGHSYGGPVIARTAMDFPDLVGGLVFVAATGNPRLSGPRWYNRFAVILPRFLLGAPLKGANAEIMPLRPQLEEMLPRWDALRLPALIVQGARDRLVNPRNADFLQDKLGNGDVTLLWRENAGHFVLWEQAALIRDALVNKFAR